MVMESTPVSGVAIKKAVTAPLLAPCFFREAAAGRTPQEQRGNGAPIRAALNTEEKRPCPRCRATVCGFTQDLTRPLITSPKRT